jgi:predicted membrane metal-binding protein
MFVLMQLGELFFRRQYSGVYALFLSATFFLIWDSWLIFSLSFQLTVAATLGVMLAADKVSWVFGQVMGFFSRFIGLPRLKVFLIPWKIFRESLVTTLSAQAFVWPILFAAFGQTSLLAFFANPLLLWIIPPATFWGILYAVFFFIVPGSENIVVLPLWGFLSLLVRGVQAWSILPTEFGQLHAQLSWGWVGVWWTVLWFLLNWRPKYTQSLN